MREEDNESEEGAVEDDYGSGEINGFDKISGEIGFRQLQARSVAGGLRMREEENESEEGAVKDDYGPGEISGEIGIFSEIGKREEPRSREKR